MAKYLRIPVTILNTTSISSVAKLSEAVHWHVVGVEVPAAWTAAVLTFQSSHDGTTYQDVHTESAEYSITALQGTNIGLNPDRLDHALFIKVRSGTSSSPVAQGADRVVQLLLRAEE